MADPTNFNLPTITDFDTFMGLDSNYIPTDYNIQQKTFLIRTSADLMLLRTGMGVDGVEVPAVDSPLGRMVQNGILDMAGYLAKSFDDRSGTAYSPYSSETLGNYSYSLARVNTALSNRTSTGVPLFDAAIAYFDSLGNPNSSAVSYDSERVFIKGYDAYDADQNNPAGREWWGVW